VGEFCGGAGLELCTTESGVGEVAAGECGLLPEETCLTQREGTFEVTVCQVDVVKIGTAEVESKLAPGGFGVTTQV
jgi:hypothetical protein